MFTGIIDQIGIVEENHDGRLTIRVPAAFHRGIKKGASIAVNGVCLTIVDLPHNTIRFAVVPETMNCSNIGLLKKESKVNVEQALRIGSRLEGHIVQGHVDRISRIRSLSLTQRMIAIDIPKGYERYIVPKGSIAVDGIALSVVGVWKGYFTVAIIPYTWDHTIVKEYKKGTIVNIEVDIIGKYIERLIAH